MDPACPWADGKRGGACPAPALSQAPLYSQKGAMHCRSTVFREQFAHLTFRGELSLDMESLQGHPHVTGSDSKAVTHPVTCNYIS